MGVCFNKGTKLINGTKTKEYGRYTIELFSMDSVVLLYHAKD
jgi:hypothetical protein